MLSSTPTISLHAHPVSEPTGRHADIGLSIHQRVLLATLSHSFTDGLVADSNLLPEDISNDCVIYRRPINNAVGTSFAIAVLSGDLWNTPVPGTTAASVVTYLYKLLVADPFLRREANRYHRPSRMVDTRMIRTAMFALGATTIRQSRCETMLREGCTVWSAFDEIYEVCLDEVENDNPELEGIYLEEFTIREDLLLIEYCAGGKGASLKGTRYACHVA